MIPVPPPDIALPGLASALDADTMAAAFATHLSDSSTSTIAVESCRPDYVRYKPGTNCLVGYKLTLCDTTNGDTVVIPAHLIMYRGDHAGTIATRRSLSRLAAHASRWRPLQGLNHVAHLPEQGGVAQIYPVDRKLRALAITASMKGAHEILTPVLGARGGQIASDEVIPLVRYKPARKALLRFRLECGKHKAAYGNLFADDRGEMLVEATRALIQAGIPTPPPLAYSASSRLLLHPAVAGQPLATLRGHSQFIGWMAPVAAELAHLHATEHGALPIHSPAAEAETIVTAARAIGTLLPDLQPRLQRLARRIAGGLEATPPALATVHGDFYDDQLLLSDKGVVLIDLDEVRQGHPLLDAGTFLAHLSAVEHHGVLHMDAARDAFAESYAHERPFRGRDLALFEAAALVRLAMGPFRRLQLDWPTAVERLVALAEQRLTQFEGGKPVVLSPSASRPAINDAALPQLKQLQDSTAMATELRTVLGGNPVTVLDIKIVRHKPGRRCLLRYDVQTGDPSSAHRERLYGKTFASERGPRVYDVAHRIAEARACGSDVLLPTPVAYLPHLKLLVQREVPGEPITHRLLAGDIGLAAHIAKTVHALHTSDVDLGRRHDLAKELDPLQQRADQIGTACPDLGTAASRCLDLIEAGRCRTTGWRWRPVHRDCYHEQFLAAPQGLSLLDLDDAAMSEPAVDIANFIAHLRLLGLQERHDSSALSNVIASLEATARTLDPDLDPNLLCFLEGTTLLRLAAIHLPRERGPWLASHLLEEAERLLTPSQQ